MHNFKWPIRVYMQDVDIGQVVYHPRYLSFAEHARTEWLRSNGFNRLEIIEKYGVYFIVVDIHAAYFVPAKLDDLLEVGVQITHLARASVTMVQEIVRNSTIVAKVVVKLAVVNLQGKPVRFPEALYQLMNEQKNTE